MLEDYFACAYLVLSDLLYVSFARCCPGPRHCVVHCLKLIVSREDTQVPSYLRTVVLAPGE